MSTWPEAWESHERMGSPGQAFLISCGESPKPGKQTFAHFFTISTWGRRQLTWGKRQLPSPCWDCINFFLPAYCEKQPGIRLCRSLVEFCTEQSKVQGIWFSGFQFSEFSGKFPPKETKTNRSWKLAWLDLTCSYKMPDVLQEILLTLTWYYKECPIISPWRKAGEFWIEVMSFLDSSWSGLASGGIYTIQCPLDIATLDKAAALDIATSTPMELGALALHK